MKKYYGVYLGDYDISYMDIETKWFGGPLPLNTSNYSTMRARLSFNWTSVALLAIL